MLVNPVFPHRAFPGSQKLEVSLHESGRTSGRSWHSNLPCALRSRFVRPDPADLAVLRAVSKGLRDAVDATGREIEEFSEEEAAARGYLSTLKCIDEVD